MSFVKVTIASDWMFYDPQEVLDLFKKTDLGRNEWLEFDAENHHFILECPLASVDALSKTLLDTLQSYLHEQQLKFDQDDHNVFEGAKIQPFERSSEEDVIGAADADEARRIAASAATTVATSGTGTGTSAAQVCSPVEDLSPSRQLIPRINGTKTVASLDREYATVFSDDVLAEVAGECDCDVSLDRTTRSIRVVGWSEQTVQQALRMLDAVEDGHHRSSKHTSFDFFFYEGKFNPKLRLIWPINTVDHDLTGAAPFQICELACVDWVMESQQWRIARTERTSISRDHDFRLWRGGVEFAHDLAENDPKHWQPLPVGHGDGEGAFSFQQLGRTLDWAAGVPNEVTKPDDGNVPAPEHEPDDKSYLTARRVRKGQSSQQVVSKETPTEEPKELRMRPSDLQEGQPSVIRHEDRDKLIDIADEDENDDFYVDFDKLEAPQQRYAITSGSTWNSICQAVGGVMEKVSMIHRSSLSFEVQLGRVYVYRFTVPSTELVPREKVPATPFTRDRWKDVFRTEKGASRALTTFSPNLTTRQIDAESILDTRLHNGKPLLQPEPRHEDAWFEIHCQDAYSDAKAIIKIHCKGNARYEGFDEKIGSVNIHHPSNTWDCCWQIIARKQEFPRGKDSAFKQFVDKAFVHNDPYLDDPTLFSRARIKINAAYFVRETVHSFAIGIAEDVRLCLKQVRYLHVHRVSNEGFAIRSFDPDIKPVEATTWWEAKLLSPHLQKMMEENKSMGIGRASWNPRSGQKVLKTMLEIASYLVTHMDDVGYASHT